MNQHLSRQFRKILIYPTPIPNALARK